MIRNESRVPWESLERAAQRVIRRARKHQNGCMTLPGIPHPQVRANERYKKPITLSARRAVFAWHYEEVAPPELEVVRTCETVGCFSPGHLTAMNAGKSAMIFHSEKTLKAIRRAAKTTRVYSDAQIRRLLRLVENGMTVTDAGQRVGIPKGTANLYVQCGGRINHQRRGTPGNPQCTRCHEFGHRRNSPECPKL